MEEGVWPRVRQPPLLTRTVSPVADQTQRLSTAQERLAATFGENVRFFSNMWVLLLLTPSPAPNSTKRPLRFSRAMVSTKMSWKISDLGNVLDSAPTCSA